LEPVGEPAYRLYNCQRCGVQVRICHRCDHGNIYCAGECSLIRRRESLRRAQARYQHSRRGALRHAARQRAWRQRREQTVTYQGCARGVSCGSVPDHPIAVSEPTDVNCPDADFVPELLSQCAFCRAPLPAWTRMYRGDWSG
jgi:hypothetical protein